MAAPIDPKPLLLLAPMEGPDQVRQWNGIVGDRIRIGQKLLVKPWTKKSAPFPPGVIPERATDSSTAAPPR